MRIVPQSALVSHSLFTPYGHVASSDLDVKVLACPKLLPAPHVAGLLAAPTSFAADISKPESQLILNHPQLALLPPDARLLLQDALTDLLDTTVQGMLNEASRMDVATASFKFSKAVLPKVEKATRYPPRPAAVRSACATVAKTANGSTFIADLRRGQELVTDTRPPFGTPRGCRSREEMDEELRRHAQIGLERLRAFREAKQAQHGGGR